MTLFTAIMPACIVNLVVLTYSKMLKKEARMDLYFLQHNENTIVTIVRRKRF
jgi:hypothetical protein